MRKLLHQAMGHEPEPLWMSAIGAFCVMAVIPAAFVIVAVAFGWGQP